MDSLEHTTRSLDRLEQRMKELFGRLAQLEDENNSLRARQESLVAERATLVQRNEEARTRVEAMIERLKALENAG
ncbi:MAG: TIGR02449 family protein [Gammaproteobacteria bacterium]|jgi:cell division protein ZapB|nr:TIGR02449 family protein [Gammaproteobacteria bacterium]